MCFPTEFSFPWLCLRSVSDTDHQCCVSRRYWQSHEAESSCSPRDWVLIFMSLVPQLIFGNPQKSWSPFAVAGGGKEGHWWKVTLFPLTSWTHQCGFFHGGWVGIGGFLSTWYKLEDSQIWWWLWFMSQWLCCNCLCYAPESWENIKIKSFNNVQQILVIKEQLLCMLCWVIREYKEDLIQEL